MPTRPWPNRTDIGGVRALFVAAALVLLAACQTVPADPYTASQLAALERAGFTREGDRYLLGLPDRLLFEFDSSDLVPERRVALGEMAAALSGVGILGARIEGHTDSVGEEAYNRALSQDRAETVMRALAAGGMDAGAMQVLGLGESDPIESNDTEEGRSQNRRVVIIVTPAAAIPL